MESGELIRNERGLYEARGMLKADDVVNTAAEILYQNLVEKEALTEPQAAAEFLQTRLSGEKDERFSVLYLDNKHKVITFEVLFRGTIDGSAVYPRVVARRGLEVNCAAVILAHNHPSGCAEPSESDRTITRRLIDALALLDIRVLDHLVVSGSGWTSLAERGWL